MKARKTLPIVAALFALADGRFHYPQLDAPTYRRFAKHPELWGNPSYRLALNRGPGLIVRLHFWPKDFRLALFTLSLITFLIYRKLLGERSLLGVSWVVIAFRAIGYENVPAAFLASAGAYALLERKRYRDLLLGGSLLRISSTFRFDVTIIAAAWVILLKAVEIARRKDVREILAILSAVSVGIPIYLRVSWVYTNALSLQELRARLSKNSFYLFKLLLYYYATYLFVAAPIALLLVAYSKDRKGLLLILLYFGFYTYATAFHLKSSIRYAIIISTLIGPRLTELQRPRIELLKTFSFVQALITLYWLFHADRWLQYVYRIFGLPLLGILMALLALPLWLTTDDYKDVYACFHFVISVIYVDVLYHAFTPMGLRERLFESPDNRW